MQIKSLIALITLFGVTALFGGVDLEIEAGVVVETNGGVVVEIDGDLTETGTGYFSGKIFSGSRTGMTSFAGMSLSSAMDGSILRTTSTAYAKGNGEGTNMKRYYELSNTGGSAVTANMQINYVSSGTYDEQNGLSGPYFIYRYASSNWTGYGSGSSSSPVAGSSVQIPTGASDWLLSEGIRIAANIFLEGPYSISTHAMTTTLGPGDQNVIPVASPYTADARTASSVPSGVTDWVLVQVRSTASGAALGSRACFVRSDGLLAADDGTTQYIGVKVAPGNYYIVIKHRNHLAVMTASAVSGLTWGTTPSTYNFTTGIGQYYGTGNGAKELESGIWGMWAGDINQDGQTTTSDFTLWFNSARAGDSGYQTTDINLDAQVTTADFTKWFNNARAGAASGVP